MSSFILTTAFSIVFAIESIGYGFYEIKINKNKPAGIVLIVLSLIRACVSYYNVYEGVRYIPLLYIKLPA